MSILTTRDATAEGEVVYVKREGPRGVWTARTAEGEVICRDQYRHDLQLFVEGAGFKWEMLHD